MSGVYESLETLDLLPGCPEFTQPLALGPPGVLHGTLDNGLKYYVMNCARPKERIAVALAVRVGSVAEEEEERGVAHILEHLAFNATERYNNHSIVAFLESIGADFGACQNAYTNTDETVFELVVPAQPTSLLERTLTVMSEFAFGIRCSQEDIDKERGAVLEEWRMGRDAAGRSQEAHWRLIMQGSKYADRLPIGEESVIRNVGSDTVRGFFERWYRPQHMAVVVVGDFSDVEGGMERVAQLIREQLGAARSSADEAASAQLPRVVFEPHKTPRCKVMVDRECADSSVLVSFKSDRQDDLTPQQYLDSLQDMLFETCLGKRLYKLSQCPEAPPFIAASVGKDPLTATVNSDTLSANAVAGSALRALEALLTEVARIRLHGFSDSELQRALRGLRSNAERMFLERDNDYCHDLRDEYLRHFLNNEAVLGAEMEARLTKTLMPFISAKAVAARANTMRASCSCVVKVVEHSSSLSDDDLARVVERVAAAEAAGNIGPWEEDDIPEHLIAPKAVPPPGSIVSRREYGGTIGPASELVLSNGMRVCFKPTKLMDDEVLLTGFAAGGLSEVPLEQLVSVRMATNIAEPIGVCGLRPSVLAEVLSGKRVGLGISQSSSYSRSFRGMQSPADLEDALQLCHLLFTTRLEVEPKLLSQVMRVARQDVEAQLRDPRYNYARRVIQVNSGGHPFFAPITMKDLDAVDASVALEFHNRSFCNPAEFTVIMTGNLEEHVVLPLICKYLASIPAASVPVPRRLQDLTPLQVAFPAEPVIEDVKVAMVNSVTQTQITLPAVLPREGRLRLGFQLSLSCRLLETRLMHKMRFRRGEVYNVEVSPTFGHDAPSNTGDAQGHVCIAFSCDPSARAKLADVALSELAKMQSHGPTEAELSTIVNLERIQFENRQQENDYWHESIATAYQSRMFVEAGSVEVVHERRLEARSEVLSSVSVLTIRDVLRQLLPSPPSSRCTVISMVPEPDSQASSSASEDGGDSQGQLPPASVTARAPVSAARRMTRSAAKATHEAPQPPQAVKARSSRNATAAPDKASRGGRPPAADASGSKATAAASRPASRAASKSKPADKEDGSANKGRKASQKRPATVQASKQVQPAGKAKPASKRRKPT